MSCNDPAPIFVGETRTIAAIVLLFIAVFSICLHLLFITAIYKLAGWESNFAFALLIAMSIFSIIRFVNDITCNVIALNYVDFCANHHLFTILGAIKLSVYFTVILITLLMTVHRLVFTLCATKASRLLPPRFAKGVLVIVCAFFIALIVITSPNEVHYHYVPSFLSYDDLSESTWEVLRLAQSITNYTFGMSNLVAYSVIFAYLYCGHNLSFSSNNELRMTVQMTLFVIIQVLYAAYWELFEATSRTTAILMTQSVISMVFYDSLLLPYLLINRTIQQRIAKTLCQKRPSIFYPRKLIVIFSRYFNNKSAVSS